MWNKYRTVLASIVFTFLTINSFGQNWSPLGAAWHYSVYVPDWQFWQDGVYELKYTNTVSINGITCKQLTGNFIGIQGFQGSPTTTVSNYPIIKTYENNSVLYRYNSFTIGFDTIVNFNAAIGDKWRLIEFEKNQAQYACGYPKPIVTVVDTGRKLINGFNLKKIVINYQIQGTTIADTIVERMASITSFLFPRHQCIIDGASLGRFICYSDNTFPLYMRPGVLTCQFIGTSLHEGSQDLLNIILFPSVVSNKLKINLNNNKILKIGFTDLYGCSLEIPELSQSNNEHEYDFSNIKTGLYFVTIYSEKGSRSFKIVKD